MSHENCRRQGCPSYQSYDLVYTYWVIILRDSSELFVHQCMKSKFMDTLGDVLTSRRTSPAVRERVLWRKVKPLVNLMRLVTTNMGVRFDIESSYRAFPSIMTIGCLIPLYPGGARHSVLPPTLGYQLSSCAGIEYSAPRPTTPQPRLQSNHHSRSRRLGHRLN